ncbi:hypothetical protein GQ600_5397 [Phytophthora cactorum]|nr:hypothetical protein GQ600_5397 [Phytophthora cactorum]
MGSRVPSASRAPKCVIKGCSCTPKLKEYVQRCVHDVDHRTVLYYAIYRCSGPHGKRTFSTIDDDYLASSPDILLAFPYLLTYQTGVSRDLFALVYDSMLTTKGISGACSNINRRRQNRFYKLLSLAGVAVEKRRKRDPAYSPPVLVTVEHNLLSTAPICSRLLEAHMPQSKIKRVIRLDHSQKFCSKLKVYGAKGKKDQSSKVRMLLLVQNEIGQIIARGLTYSENHAETAAILKPVASKLAAEPSASLVCITDNANGTRGLIEKVFSGAVTCKQDPFHVIQRFSEEIKDEARRKWLSIQLSSAIYKVDRTIRLPEEMAERFSSVLGKIAVSSLNDKEPEWQGCISSNLNQIRMGDLFVDEADYSENGCTVRVLSTSQLEAVHSKLRKLLDRVVSYEMGLRVLDILSCRSQARQKPEFFEFDFLSMSFAAVLCREQLASTPQLEFMYELVASQATRSCVPTYRVVGVSNNENRPWERLGDIIRLRIDKVEGRMLDHHGPASDIRRLLLSVHVKRKQSSRAEFVTFLGLEPEYESTMEFSSNEFSLLQQIRAEQLASKQPWENSKHFQESAARAQDDVVKNLPASTIQHATNIIPELMDATTREHLRNYAASLRQRTPGKWMMVFKEHQNNNPDSKLSYECS